MRLGYIDYLNCYPFYYDMLEKEPLPGVEIIPGYPGDLNRMMLAGDLDISPISAGAYPDIQDHAVLLPDVCLSSLGYVRSVILRSRVPIEELDRKRIGLSSASRTSATLLQILLRKYYHIEPNYRPAKPNPCLKEEKLDAALVIGNEAITQNAEPVPYTYDLGDLWLRKTGFPVVFAVFAVQKSCLKIYSDQIRAVTESYRRSLGCLETERERLILKAWERYPNIQYDIHAYYQLLQYQFTPEMKDALKFYFRLAEEAGIFRRVNEPEFMRK